MNKAIVLLGIALLLIACSSLSQEEAESIASQFINQNVKFFAREGNSTEALNAYTVESMTSYREGSAWTVIAHIVSQNELGEEKKNDLIVKMDAKGEIIEFNGRKLSAT